MRLILSECCGFPGSGMIAWMLLGAARSDAAYAALVTLHVICAVVGFGAVAISGVYGATARHQDREAASEETRRYFRSRGQAEWLVLVVPFLGAAALAVRRGGGDFGEAWVVAAAVVWLVAAVLLLSVVRPAERRIRDQIQAIPGDPPGRPDRQLVGPARAGNRLMWAAIGCDVLFVVALVLMVYQPA
jgi:uncharacterized membrane protein